MEKAMKQTKINDGKWFDFSVYVIAIVLFLIVLYPIVFVLSASISDPSAVINGKMILWPVGFTLKAYAEVFHNHDVWIGYRNTLFYTVLGTLINLILTTVAAYPLSRRDLPGQKLLMFLIVFTMFFQGGLIPTFLIVKDLHMVDTFWALILPTAVTTYNLIVMRTYFQSSIPWEMQEAAMIDGCSNIRLFWHIIIPLSKPIIAVMVLFYAVSHWNSYFNALIYLRSRDLYPLQLVLREILITNQNALMDDSTSMVDSLMLAETMKYALIIIASIPVLILYPFAQKHFVKGVMIGSIKG